MSRQSGVNVGTYLEGVTTGTFSGPFTAPQLVTFTYTRLGRIVTLDVNAVSAAAGSAVTNATCTGAVPSGYRPVTTINAPVTVVSNSLLINILGKAEVQAGGNINIYLDSLQTGLFAITGNNGWSHFSVTYVGA